MAGIYDFIREEYEKAKKAFGLIGGIKLRNDHAVKQLYQTGIPELFSGRIGGQTLEQGIQNRLQAGSLRPALSPQQMVDAGLNIVGMAPLGMTVWHGSPHKFDKFDMSKIGTGEGAQAYGHGLYVAEHPNVAQKYADDGAIKYGDLLRIGKHEIPRDDWRFEAAIAAKRAIEDGEGFPRNLSPKQEKWAELVRGRGLDVEVAEPQLYKVDIPDEAVARMLDWDKPLSQQGGVDAFAKLPHFARPLDATEAANVEGQRLYQRLANKLGDDGAAKLLRDAGIPGIRYLDGGSRGAGTGTSNFVLFDDQLPRILERNGVPTGLQPWGPGEWGGTSGLPHGFQDHAPRDSADLLASFGVPVASTALLAALLAKPEEAQAK